MFTIDKNILDSEKHLYVTEDNYYWVDYHKDWVFGAQSTLNVKELLETWNITLPTIVDKKYIAMKRQLNIRGNVPWSKLIGKRPVRKKLNIIIAELKKFFKEHESDSYLEILNRTQSFIWSLAPAPIDKTSFEVAKAIADTQGYLKSIIPSYNDEDNLGYINPPRYCRATKTGRLKVISGLNVVGLKKNLRDIVQGCRMIDFSSMEPRFLLATNGDHVEGDIYEWIGNKAKLKGNRTKQKVEIISSMYGSKKIPEVDKILKIEKKISEIKKSKKGNMIKNYFGRPIFAEERNDRHLLSLWLQSSAADAALLAFEIFFKNNPNLKPHWIIHDAVIFSGIGSIPDELKITENLSLPVKVEEINSTGCEYNGDKK